jgi:tetratricopeptide (TPR) repeat protein
LAVLENPADSDAWFVLGQKYEAASEFDGAFAAYQRAIQLDLDNVRAQRALDGLFERNWVSTLETQALLEPENDELWGDVGDQYANQGQREQALRYYIYALVLDSSDSEWRQKVVEFGGDNNLVVEVMSAEAVNHQDDDEWLGDFGDALMEAGREDEACQQWRTALALDPEDGEWQSNIARCDGQAPPSMNSGGAVSIDSLGETLEDQLVEVDRQIALDPANDELLGTRGKLLVRADRVDEAMESFWAALALDPRDSEWPYVMMIAGGVTRVDILEQQVETLDTDDELWGDLGDCYIDVGRRDEALEAYQRAQALDGDDEEWRTKLELLNPE